MAQNWDSQSLVKAANVSVPNIGTEFFFLVVIQLTNSLSSCSSYYALPSLKSPVDWVPSFCDQFLEWPIVIGIILKMNRENKTKQVFFSTFFQGFSEGFKALQIEWQLWIKGNKKTRARDFLRCRSIGYRDTEKMLTFCNTLTFERVCKWAYHPFLGKFKVSTVS